MQNINGVELTKIQKICDLLPIDFVAEPEIKKITSGLINQTWKVGGYVFQALGPMFNNLVMADIQFVTSYKTMLNLSFKIPSLIPFKTNGQNQGIYGVVDEQGVIWRVMSYIEHSNSDNITYENKIQNAAVALAELHMALKECEYTPKYKIDHFHDTDYFMKKLQQKSIEDKDISELQEFILENYRDINCSFSDYVQLIHGDPKLDNFLFDEGGSVVGMIDFDTVMLGSVLIDLGDALRSWCNKDGVFDKQLFIIIKNAYLANIMNDHKPSEQEMFCAVRMITLELAARFLIDYLEGGVYFHLHDDKEKNIALCLAKVKKYVKYFETI